MAAVVLGLGFGALLTSRACRSGACRIGDASSARGYGLPLPRNVGAPTNRCSNMDSVGTGRVPLDWLPVVGPAIGQQRWFLFLASTLAVAAPLVLARSRLGLQIRAAGESPLGLESVGWSVSRTRFVAAAIGGTFSGPAGGSLGGGGAGILQSGDHGGAGFLAVALPWWVGSPLRVAELTLGFGILS